MKKETLKRIFVIEDDRFFGEVVKQELSKLKQVVVEVFSSAEECMGKMNEAPELIILDFALHKGEVDHMNGHEALNHFRTNNAAQKVLFVSGKSDLGLLEQYKVFRSVDYIEKSDACIRRMVEKVKYQLTAA